MIPRLVVFDLDNTLAESKAPIAPSMADTIARLLERTQVAIITGGKQEQLLEQVADRLPASARRERLYLLPTSGGALYTYAGEQWLEAYAEALAEEEEARIGDELLAAARETGLADPESPSYGPRLEFRGAQVSFSALGQEAPLAEKEAWDPEGTKRRALAMAAAQRLPGYDVKSGGLTTVDVTRKGVNKAFGIRKLAELLSIPVSEMLYIGDALYPGGNDETVMETGIPTHAVEGPKDTEAVIEALLKDAT